MARHSKLAAIFGHPTRLEFDPRAVPADHSNSTRPTLGPEYEYLWWVLGQRRDVGLDKEARPKIERITDAKGPRRVTERWVNVFLFDADRKATSWFVELWVDDVGRHHLNPAATKDQRLAWSHDPEASAGELHPELPRRVAGRRRYVALVATPFRLSDDCITVLETDNTLMRFTTPVNPASEKLLEYGGAPVGAGDVAGTEPYLVLPVEAPFDVARTLAGDIEQARSERAVLLGQDGESKEAEADDKETAEKYFFCRSLLALVKHPKLGSELYDDFAGSKRYELEIFVDRHERKLAREDLKAEATGADLVGWLRREFVQLLMNGCEKDDSERLLIEMAAITSGLGQTAAGLSYLGSLKEREPMTSFMRRMFDGPERFGQAELQIATMGLKHFAGSFGVVQKAKLFNKEIAIASVVHEINEVLGKVAPGWRSSFDVQTKVLKDFALRPDLAHSSSPARDVHVRVQALRASHQSLQRLGKILGGADMGLKLLDTFNIGLALRVYFATEVTREDLRGKRGMAIAASSGSLLASILNQAFELAGRDKVALGLRVSTRLLGFVCAAHAACVGYAAGKDAWDKGDYDAAVAMYASTTLTVAGAILSFAASGSSLGPLGGALAVLGGLAYFVYSFVKDSDLETMVLHSAFGWEAGEKAPEVGWSPISMDCLADSWTNQSIALETIQRQFALGIGRRIVLDKTGPTPLSKARIYVGHVDRDTKFEITWQWQARHGSGEHTQHWVPKRGSQKEPTFEYGPLLQQGDDHNPFFDVDIPQAAWDDCGYEIPSGGYRFDNLTISVTKTYDLGSRTGRIPHHGPLLLTVQQGTIQTNPDTRALSIEAKTKPS